MYAQVVPAKRGLLSLPFFDYLVPEELQTKIQVGHLVKIPLRSREEFGVVRSISESTLTEKSKIKAISGIVNERPFFSKCEIDFLEEISSLYHTSLGLLVKTALPPLQKRKISKLEIDPEDKSNKPKKFVKPKMSVYQNDEQKHEYYQNIISADGQTLILVPEVADIPQIKVMLINRTDEIAVVTSYLSKKELFSSWMDIWSGKKKIIIGTRAALFLSFHDLRTIILDNEAHFSHKSWDLAPRFHTKDAALICAKYHEAEIHLTCHMPSVESYYFLKENIYDAVNGRFFSNIQHAPMLVNMQDEARGGNYGPLSNDLQEILLNIKNGSIYLFCHRKGTASYVMCRDCGTVMKCEHCNRSLTYHESRGQLICHHCGRSENMNSECKSCGGVNLARFGVGVEAIQKEVKRLLRNDKREVVVVEESEQTLKRIDPDKDQIIIGTQFAWPHLNWKKISVMAFIDADTPLFIPEYRIVENVWQYIFDAAYRLPVGSRFFIQSSHPENIVYKALMNPQEFYETELKERKLFNYPPYRFILKLFYGAPSKELGKREIDRLRFKLSELTKTAPDIKITPPLELFPAIKKGKYWQAMILKLPYKNYKQLSRMILQFVPEGWKVDPNPNTLLSL